LLEAATHYARLPGQMKRAPHRRDHLLIVKALKL